MNEASEQSRAVSLDEHAAGIALLKPMISTHGTSLFLALIGLWVPGLFIAAGFLAVVTMTLMTAASWREAGRGYAIRHLVLYLVLAPVFLVGPLLVPFLVWSDLTKRRSAIAQQAEVAV